MKEFEFETENATYKMVLGNAMTSWKAIKQALKLLKDVNLTSKDKTTLTLDVIKSLLSKVGEPEFESLEKIVFENTFVLGEQTYKLSGAKATEHFNNYREDLVEVLMKGLQFQFLDFLPRGIRSQAQVQFQ